MNAAVNVTPMRRTAFDGQPFTKHYHAYYDLWGRISFAAMGILQYFQRYAHGYHCDAAEATVSDIARAFKCSRPTVIAALNELRALNVIADDGTPGSTRVRTYHLLGEIEWSLPEQDETESDTTCQESLQVTRQESLQVEAPTRQESLQDGAATRQESLQASPIKEKREKKPTERNAQARATSPDISPTPAVVEERAATDTAVAPSSLPSKPTNEYDAHLAALTATLQRIPNWRHNAKALDALLEEFCPLSVGGVGVVYDIAFVRERASTFYHWCLRKIDDGDKPRADTGAFRSFLNRTKPEEYAAWQAQQAREDSRAKQARRNVNLTPDERMRADSKRTIAIYESVLASQQQNSRTNDTNGAKTTRTGATQ